MFKIMIQTQTQTQFVKVVWHFTVINTNYIYNIT